jgi:uncharacterized protein
MDVIRRARLKEYFEDHPELGVVSAFLFGSHAEGRAHRESDVDVAILLDWSRHPGARERFEARIRICSDLIAVLHENEVDLVVLNDLPPLFARHILWNGERIFLADPEADFAFLHKTQVLAAELGPYLERLRRLRLEALRR